MRQRNPGEDRDFREDMDDMGDDEQAEEIALTERYIHDPPEDYVIEEPEQNPDGLSSSAYDEQAAREGEDERWPDRDGPAESDAVNPTNRP